jgi:hypothetical protein
MEAKSFHASPLGRIITFATSAGDTFGVLVEGNEMESAVSVNGCTCWYSGTVALRAWHCCVLISSAAVV